MSKIIKEHMNKLLAYDKRLTPRKLDEYRNIEVQTGFTKTAEGSSKVKLGNTEVMVGVKFELSDPFPDTPEKGGIMVNAELTPMSSPDFESGPPGIDAIEIARVVDRGIRESGAVDFQKLCIEKGEKVWNILIDIVTINHDGNLMDASALAAIAALKDARFPSYDGEKVDYKNLSDKKVELKYTPVSCTVVKIGDKLLIDPDIEEEKVISSRLTVATLEDGNICAMQKGGDEPLDIDAVKSMVDLAIKKCDQLRGKL